MPTTRQLVKLYASNREKFNSVVDTLKTKSYIIIAKNCIKKGEIRIYKTQEYLGLWIEDSEEKPEKLRLKFSPDNLERLKQLDDLEQLCVSADMISAGEFRRDYLSNSHIELDPNDSQPTTWKIGRRC